MHQLPLRRLRIRFNELRPPGFGLPKRPCRMRLSPQKRFRGGSVPDIVLKQQLELLQIDEIREPNPHKMRDKGFHDFAGHLNQPDFPPITGCTRVCGKPVGTSILPNPKRAIVSNFRSF